MFVLFSGLTFKVVLVKIYVICCLLFYKILMTSKKGKLKLINYITLEI